MLESLVGGGGGADTAAVRTVKAVAWARVSTDMQEERGLSLPEQLREIAAYAKRLGFEIAAEFSEAASAFQKESKRVEFHRMLEYARSTPGLGAILVHDFSRFSRDSVRAKTLVRELRAQGIRVISLNDPEVDPETVAGVYMEAITFAKNEAFSREVAFHTRKGCRSNVQTRDLETGWCYKNGGQPLFGYKSVQFQRGEEKKGRPIIKSIWMPDDTLVNGRPMHEWARECLLMAAKGASLDQLRDFCNANEIPARRKRYWSQGTWNSLLQPAVLMKYCGHEVWNVHRKNGTKRPPEEWVVVEGAHPALIMEDEAKAIMSARHSGRGKRFDRRNRHAKTSRYLLSGGPFTCARCGSNMVGYYSSSGRYYLCGSHAYRKGLGCGPGVFVRQAEVEEQVVEGLRELLEACSEGLAAEVNEELQKLWEAANGRDPRAARRLEEVDRKIANIRAAITNGLDDIAWANEELRKLGAAREELERAADPADAPLRIDTEAIATYERELGKTLGKASPEAARGLIQECVAYVRLLPESLEVDVLYQLPPVAMKMGPGGTDAKAHRDRRGSGGRIRRFAGTGSGPPIAGEGVCVACPGEAESRCGGGRQHEVGEGTEESPRLPGQTFAANLV